LFRKYGYVLAAVDPGTTSNRPAKLLYDTTVYIDILQDRFPRDGEQMLRATDAWHSPVTEAELAATCGLLDPTHPETRKIIGQVGAVIERRPATGRLHRIVRFGARLGFCPAYSPDCRDAGKISGDKP